MNGWTWGNEGVDVYPDHLVWYEKEGPVRFASGAACEQKFDDFLARGPWVNGVPAEVVEAVTLAVKKILADSAQK
jgi:hypothetical protein